MTIQPIGKNDDYFDDHPKNQSNLKAKSISEENLRLLIEVINSKQNNETWKLFRLLLANSTNKFINTTDIKVEKCRYVYIVQ